MDLAAFGKALSDEKRVTMLELLTERDLCVCEFMEILGMTQSVVSHHLKTLKHAGLVLDHREGKWVFYTLNESVFNQYQHKIQNILTSVQPKEVRRAARNNSLETICILHSAGGKQ